MRIMRSDDEQIVSAQARNTYGQNNIYYNQQNGEKGAYDAEVDFSYSGRQYMNEIARDRQFGTGNIRPVERDMNSFSERMYKDAIEEASRVKTMGYFNDLSKIEGTNPLHNTIPGRLRDKANVHLQNNVRSVNHQSSNQQGVNNQTTSNHIANNQLTTNQSKITANNIEGNQKVYKESSFNFTNLNNEMISPSGNSYNKPVNQGSYASFNKEMVPPNGMAQQNVMQNVDLNKTGNLDSLMNKVVDNLQHEIETQMVEEGREALREKVKVQANNIPYKKTKEYTGGAFGKQIAEQQLQVRDYKVDKDGKDNKKMGFLAWLLSVPFMIAPIIGFLVSGIVSFTVPKDPAYKGFARFCLTIHMVLSIVAVYMYFTGRLDISLIKRYINI